MAASGHWATNVLLCPEEEKPCPQTIQTWGHPVCEYFTVILLSSSGHKRTGFLQTSIGVVREMSHTDCSKL